VNAHIEPSEYAPEYALRLPFPLSLVEVNGCQLAREPLEKTLKRPSSLLLYIESGQQNGLMTGFALESGWGSGHEGEGIGRKDLGETWEFSLRIRSQY
jgi:hypothetical protein